ncbi:MAG: hypothetical protein DRJ50_12485 [Actinobacteria bacterium]|nr:MAG: hypothetical protein DRJ50_12485 [Actinomycetota bacterium]
MEVVPRYRFEAMIADALDDLPVDLEHVLDNVVVQAVDRHSDEPSLLGLYEGVPHTERSGMEGPDVVSIFRIPLCEACADIDELAEEVYVTVIHELAHAAGIDDDRLHELGWG